MPSVGGGIDQPCQNTRGACEGEGKNPICPSPDEELLDETCAVIIFAFLNFTPLTA